MGAGRCTVVSLVAVTVAAACGRLGFDDHAAAPVIDGGGGSDASLGPAAALCDPRALGDVALGSGEQIELARTVAVGDVYGVALRTTANNLYLVQVDASLRLVGQHLPLANDYQLWSANQLAGNLLVGCLDVADGHGYLKAISADWDGYTAEQLGSDAVLDPPLAALATDTSDALYAYVDGNGALAMELIDDTGATQTSQPTAIADVQAASVAPLPTGARVVVAHSTDACDVLDSDTALATTQPTTIAPCANPVIAARPDGTTGIAYVADGAVRLRIGGVDRAIGAGFAPRIAPGTAAGSFVVAWIDSGVATLELGAFTATAGSAAATDATAQTFDLLADGSRAFWVASGTTVSTASICEP